MRVTGLFGTFRQTLKKISIFSFPLGPRGPLWSGADPPQGGEISDDLPNQREALQQLSLLCPIIGAERLLVK